MAIDIDNYRKIIGLCLGSRLSLAPYIHIYTYIYIHIFIYLEPYAYLVHLSLQHHGAVLDALFLHHLPEHKTRTTTKIQLCSQNDRSFRIAQQRSETKYLTACSLHLSRLSKEAMLKLMATLRVSASHLVVEHVLRHRQGLRLGLHHLGG